MTDNSYDKESRLRAIAWNAVREAMLVFERWDKPFTDEDAARADNIFSLLHLTGRNIDYEHAPLVVDQQPAVSPTVRKIADLLEDKLPSDKPADSVLETAEVKVTLPKANRS